MTVKWISREDLLAALELSEQDLAWFRENFREQMKVLVREEDGRAVYASDAINLLRGLGAMRAQGATPDQIKGWFGLA